MPGYIESYVHGHRIGVLIELACADDFALRTEEFKSLAKNLCLQIAASRPKAMTQDLLDPDFREAELDWTRQRIEALEPEERLRHLEEAEKRLDEFCLLPQQFIKEPGRSVAEEIQRVSSELGVVIEVLRFERWELGEVK